MHIAWMDPWLIGRFRDSCHGLIRMLAALKDCLIFGNWLRESLRPGSRSFTPAGPGDQELPAGGDWSFAQLQEVESFIRDAIEQGQYKPDPDIPVQSAVSRAAYLKLLARVQAEELAR